MVKYIVTEQQMVKAVRYALELNIKDSGIIDLLMIDVIEEIETVLEDDCERMEGGADNASD